MGIITILQGSSLTCSWIRNGPSLKSYRVWHKLRKNLTHSSGVAAFIKDGVERKTGSKYSGCVVTSEFTKDKNAIRNVRKVNHFVLTRSLGIVVYIVYITWNVMQGLVYLGMSNHGIDVKNCTMLLLPFLLNYNWPSLMMVLSTFPQPEWVDWWNIKWETKTYAKWEGCCTLYTI